MSVGLYYGASLFRRPLTLGWKFSLIRHTTDRCMGKDMPPMPAEFIRIGLLVKKGFVFSVGCVAVGTEMRPAWHTSFPIPRYLLPRSVPRSCLDWPILAVGVLDHWVYLSTLVVYSYFRHNFRFLTLLQIPNQLIFFTCFWGFFTYVCQKSFSDLVRLHM